MSKENGVKSENTRQRCEKELQAAGAEGLSKAELRRRVGDPNVGTFRRVIRSMVDAGEVEVELQPHPQYGSVAIHRWRGGQPIPGQTKMEA